MMVVLNVFCLHNQFFRWKFFIEVFGLVLLFCAYTLLAYRHKVYFFVLTPALDFHMYLTGEE